MINNNFLDQSIYNELQQRYNKATLNKKELASELGVSLSAVNNCISQGYGIPDYLKLGDAKNARVVFPIICVVSFLSNTVKVA